MKKTTDWRAVCGKTARTVRREGSVKADPYPYLSPRLMRASSTTKNGEREMCEMIQVERKAKGRRA